jgi:hypothetical protein
MHTDIHASIGRTHDPSVRASEDSSCLKPSIDKASQACNVTCNVTNSCSGDGRASALQSAREPLVPIRLVSVFAANTNTFLSSSWDVVLAACVVRPRVHHRQNPKQITGVSENCYQTELNTCQVARPQWSAWWRWQVCLNYIKSVMKHDRSGVYLFVLWLT